MHLYFFKNNINRKLMKKTTRKVKNLVHGYLNNKKINNNYKIINLKIVNKLEINKHSLSKMS